MNYFARACVNVLFTNRDDALKFHAYKGATRIRREGKLNSSSIACEQNVRYRVDNQTQCMSLSFLFIYETC